MSEKRGGGFFVVFVNYLMDKLRNLITKIWRREDSLTREGASISKKKKKRRKINMYLEAKAGL